MKGDFSRWNRENKNFNGVLHQQGRVLLDSDWNAAARINNAWQDQAGRDAIGPGVAAVPSEVPDSFKVEAAEVVTIGSTKHVELDILPGRVWADGLLTYLTGSAAVKRRAVDIGPLLQDPSLTPGVRDAVILEVWREAVNGFQVPRELIEPALGGPDTTERVHTAFAFKLLPLGPTDRCEDLPGKLKEDLSKKGSIRVTLDPSKTVGGECPVEEGGGYTGFEHHLFRIEIAELDAEISGTNGPMFKWSRFNGGLVGRGEFDAVNKKAVLTANFQAVTTSGLSSFYLEAVQYNKYLGHWTVTYGTTATLNDGNELDLTDPPYFGTMPTADEPVFFRLWDGIKPIKDFPIATAAVKAGSLANGSGENGIRVEFDTGGKIYNPGDYWTFEVRAGGIGNPPVSVPVFTLGSTLETGLSTETNSPALQTEFSGSGFPISTEAVVEEKIAGSQWQITDPKKEETYLVKKEGGLLNVYHLTLIKDGPPDGILYHRVPLAILEWDGKTEIDETSIHDCRRGFRPLTDIEGCCTVTVGVKGDFHKIQEAVDFFTGTPGGRICVLPGLYTENIKMEGAVNIVLSGCGARSRVVSPPPGGEFGQALPVIHVKDSVNIRIESLAVEAHETGIGILLEGSPPGRVTMDNTVIEEPARLRDITLDGLRISAALRCGVEVFGGQFITIRANRIEMENLPSPWPGIFMVGDDVLIENNEITVTAGTESNENDDEIASFVTGRGGLQVGGTSDRVRIVNNLIRGGIGNGITLGSIKTVDIEYNDVGGYRGWVVGIGDPCNPCRPAGTYIPPVDDEGGNETRYVSAGALSDIHIETNRIFDMGLNGIGVVGFFNLEAQDEFISVERLTIRANEIRGNLRRELEDIPDDMLDSMGYGGISLADVEDLVIDTNVIEDNGPDFYQPVCGIFVLHGEGIDIFDNRILNNGAKTGRSSNLAKPGPRGGIFIVYGVAPTEGISISKIKTEIPRQNGVPAARIHDNIVSTPLGRALSITALGPVSVVGNQFTSRGMVLKKDPTPSFIAAAVAIVNLGLSNELYLQLMPFAKMTELTIDQYGETRSEPYVSGDAVFFPKPGLDDLTAGSYLANGNVLFTDNQCTLDLLESGVSISASSILIATLDDLGFHNNQCDCSLLDDIVISQGLLFGFSLRVTGNRFKEGILNALFSAITLGLLNMTVYNQGTHCIWVSGFYGKGSPNTELWTALKGGEGYCTNFNNIFDRWRD